mgnify:CR=1 FL=1
MNIWHRAWSKMVLLTCCLFLWGNDTCLAAEDMTKIQEEMIENLELQEVEHAVQQLLEDDISFLDMIKNLVSEGQAFDRQTWEQIGKNIVQEAIGIQKDIFLQILLLIILAAVCTNLSQVFSNPQISETAFCMCYMMMFVLLIKSVTRFSEEIHEALNQSVAFMRVLLPSYYLAVTVSTGNATATLTQIGRASCRERV